MNQRKNLIWHLKMAISEYGNGILNLMNFTSMSEWEKCSDLNLLLRLKTVMILKISFTLMTDHLLENLLVKHLKIWLLMKQYSGQELKKGKPQPPGLPLFVIEMGHAYFFLGAALVI